MLALCVRFQEPTQTSTSFLQHQKKYIYPGKLESTVKVPFRVGRMKIPELIFPVDGSRGSERNSEADTSFIPRNDKSGPAEFSVEPRWRDMK